MDFQRRLVAGRLSEVMGAVTVPVDRWMRILGMRRVAKKEVSLIGYGHRADVEAYAAGINSCIAEGRLPIEFTLLRYKPEPWTVGDSLSWVKMISWSLSVNWQTEILGMDDESYVQYRKART
jgi:penicillin amidase